MTGSSSALVTFFSGGETEPAPENVIFLTRSDGGGVPFAKAEKTVDVREGARSYDPTLWMAPNGA